MPKYCLKNARKDKRLTEDTVTISNVQVNIHQFNRNGQPAKIPKFLEIESEQGTLHIQFEECLFEARA